MDKKSILGIAIVAVLFIGFAYFSNKEQKKFQEQKAIYDAYMDSVARAARPVAEVDSLASDAVLADPADADSLASVARQRQVETLGEALTAAREADPEYFTVENDVMTVTFSTLGGQIVDVTLKDYTRYAPRGERNQLVQLIAVVRVNGDCHGIPALRAGGADADGAVIGVLHRNGVAGGAGG